ncbi:MAG: Sel1-like repeat-containing protein kinase family protein, partial [Haliea sp.]
ARPAHGQGELTEITLVESVIGSPKYMSPEQSLGQSLDGRSDIYSLGVMLYQMLIGEVPFAGKTVSELSLQRMEKQVPRLPCPLGHLQPLMNGLLAYEREKRFTDCGELQRSIKSILAQDTARPRSPPNAARDTTPTGDTTVTHMREQSPQAGTKGVLPLPLAAVTLVAAGLALGLAGFVWYWLQEPDLIDLENATPAQLTDVTGEALPAPIGADSPPPSSSAPGTPSGEEFFAFYDAVNSGLVERQATFIGRFPESVFADMLRVKLASDRELFTALQEQADRGDTRAQLVVSELYDTGWAGERSQARARDYARRAARGGNPFAEYHFAMLVLSAAGTDAERREGIQVLEQAANQGFYLAQTVLANYLLEGRLLGRDIDAGLKLLEAAGNQGDRNALFNLGVILDSGLYVERAYPERAKGYFERAAQLGHPQARNYLNEP